MVVVSIRSKSNLRIGKRPHKVYVAGREKEVGDPDPEHTSWAGGSVWGRSGDHLGSVNMH